MGDGGGGGGPGGRRTNGETRGSFLEVSWKFPGMRRCFIIHNTGRRVEEEGGDHVFLLILVVYSTYCIRRCTIQSSQVRTVLHCTLSHHLLPLSSHPNTQKIPRSFPSGSYQHDHDRLITPITSHHLITHFSPLTFPPSPIPYPLIPNPSLSLAVVPYSTIHTCNPSHPPQRNSPPRLIAHPPHTPRRSLSLVSIPR